MALSYGQYLGDGSTTNFEAPFEYLSKTHVSVRVDGSEVPFAWVGTYTVQVTPAPANGKVVEVRRTTPRAERLVTFSDGSTLVEADLNVSTLQSFFLSQEAFDQGSASLGVTSDGSYSAGYRRISLVADPVADDDVATKGWTTNNVNSNVAEAIAARNAASSYASQAQTSATSANTSKTQAAASAAAGDAARVLAQQHRDDAAASATAAAASKGQVDTAAVAVADNLALSNAAKTAAANSASAAATSASSAAYYAGQLNPMTKMDKSANLSDVANPTTARQNIGAHNAGNLTTGTVPDARLPSYLLQAALDGRYVVPANLPGASVNYANSAGWASGAGNSSLLEGVGAAFFRNVSNMNAGVLAPELLSPRLTGHAYMEEGTVGTYAFMSYQSSPRATSFGTNRAGSSLYPTNSDDAPSSFGPSQNGTWRCYGRLTEGSGDQSITLFGRLV
ncbi:phage tail fiber protein [Devosia sp. 66-22]|uniref:phage tail fiber domain-containing protein n=1 Tax=Devosia sp. 66-22 TaxID=1895753 RepID=UPI000925F6A8|nr:phage tail fiber protein [Devosia sp. 66-22]OJX53638.1 MAG: hypothetical protein BGO81_13810 [Devosia sp. 66-22]